MGAALVWLFYHPHWRETENQGNKLAVFCTAPAIRSPLSNFLCELIGTFVLVIVATAFTSKRLAPGGTPPGIGPVLVGGLVWSIGLSLGGTTGYAINPARDFAPRVAHAVLPIAGKGSSDWSYAWIPVAGPICGAMVADYWLSGKKWAGPREGVNIAGYGAWAVGFVIGILPFLPISEETKVYLQPAAVYSFIAGFIVYVILAKAGLQSKVVGDWTTAGPSKATAVRV